MSTNECPATRKMVSEMDVTQEVVEALELFVQQVVLAESRWHHIGHPYYQNDIKFRHTVITARRELNARLEVLDEETGK